MDEPVTNLDESGRAELVGVIRRFWEEEGFSLLYVTHDATDEPTFARRTIQLYEGRLIA